MKPEPTPNPTDDALHLLLRTHWGYERFRPGQLEIIRSVVRGRDTLAILPTGGGKSLCYQLAGLARGGLTLVVSPLIALMHDQVLQLRQRGLQADFANSSLPAREIDRRLTDAQQGRLQYLYVAPERLLSRLLLERLDDMDIRLLAVDEAHCISQWGYDFRPAYTQLNRFREHIAHAPTLALTASATPDVQQDILAQLDFRNAAVFVEPFSRPNLRYIVRSAEDLQAKVLEVCQRMPGSGIVYVRTRRDAETLAYLLQQGGVSAAAYHAGLAPDDRTRIQTAWLQGQARIVAATTAFGMGIDKPDVRLVAHYGMPPDLESYYQEAGRAGRDGQPAFAVLLYDPTQSKQRYRQVMRRFPTFNEVCTAYGALCDRCQIGNTPPPDTAYPFDLRAEARALRIEPEAYYRALQILHDEGLIDLNDQPERSASLHWRVGRSALTQFTAHHPVFAPPVDALLRETGSAAFDRPAPLDLQALAQRLGTSQASAEAQLKQLQVCNVLYYKPPGVQPTVRFLCPRQQPTPTTLHWPVYEALQQRARDRLRAMEAYATEEHTCRQVLIASYFGEHNTPLCGQCDYCRERKPYLDMPPADAAREIEAHLQAEVLKRPGAYTYRQLVHGLRHGTTIQREQALRRLLERGTLVAADDTRLWPV